MAAYLDCTRCGACCVNLPENQREDFLDYVELEPSDILLGRKDLVRKHVRYHPSGVPHLRLDRQGRCLALAGSVGGRVRCTIYHHRPRACRRVKVGSDLCYRYRCAQGLEEEPG